MGCFDIIRVDGNCRVVIGVVLMLEKCCLRPLFRISPFELYSTLEEHH